MTHVTISTGGPGLSGNRLLRLAAAVAACHRWAYAMQMRYDRLGARGVRPGAPGFDTLMAEIEPGPRDF